MNNDNEKILIDALKYTSDIILNLTDKLEKQEERIFHLEKIVNSLELNKQVLNNEDTLFDNYLLKDDNSFGNKKNNKIEIENKDNNDKIKIDMLIGSIIKKKNSYENIVDENNLNNNIVNNEKVYNNTLVLEQQLKQIRRKKNFARKF
jgi:hypothetical protein